MGLIGAARDKRSAAIEGKPGGFPSMDGWRRMHRNSKEESEKQAFHSPLLTFYAHCL